MTITSFFVTSLLSCVSRPPGWSPNVKDETQRRMLPHPFTCCPITHTTSNMSVWLHMHKNCCVDLHFFSISCHCLWYMHTEDHLSNIQPWFELLRAFLQVIWEQTESKTFQKMKWWEALRWTDDLSKVHPARRPWLRWYSGRPTKRSSFDHRPCWSVWTPKVTREIQWNSQMRGEWKETKMTD